MRKTLFVNPGKGRKNRYSILSETVIEFLIEYYSEYDIKEWLFPGIVPDTHLSIRTA